MNLDLKDVANYCNISPEDLLDEIANMKRTKIIQQHPYSISQGADGRFRTYVSDDTKESGRRLIAKSTLQSVHDAIVADYDNCMGRNDKRNMDLEKLYTRWMIWRRDMGADSKTIKENANDWKKYIEHSTLKALKVCEITTYDLEEFFLIITKSHAITYKRLSNIRSVLSGVFKHGVRIGIISHSIVFDIDYRQFRTRCKPETSNKKAYSDDERKALLLYFEDKTDVYSLAISFAFRLMLRIGELQALEKSDVRGDKLRVEKSVRRNQAMNDDLSFGRINYEIDVRTKGNATAGIREVALSPKAQNIAAKAIELYPDGKYLFMRDGKPILGGTFNRHLERACKSLNIPYLPSHQIRFTSATNLAEAGVPINQISHDLGHAYVKTTYSYIRQREMDDLSKSLIAQIQDV